MTVHRNLLVRKKASGLSNGLGKLSHGFHAPIPNDPFTPLLIDQTSVSIGVHTIC